MTLQIIKEFFKPDKRKIVLFVLLTVILLLYFMYMEGCFCGWGYVDPKTNELILGEFAKSYINSALLFRPISSIIAYYPYRTENYKIISIFSEFLPFDLIYWYLISCFIIWIYDKVRIKWQRS